MEKVPWFSLFFPYFPWNSSNSPFPLIFSGCANPGNDILQQDGKIIVLDFVENYSFVIQDDVFIVKIAKLLCIHLLYIMKSPYNSLESSSICVIYDYWIHNQSAVHAFLASSSSFVETKLSFVKKYRSLVMAQSENVKITFSGIH